MKSNCGIIGRMTRKVEISIEPYFYGTLPSFLWFLFYIKDILLELLLHFF